jgi:RNA polymerase sigma factor for flagellar operon FliA
MIEAESLMTAPSPVTLDDHASPQGATLLAEPTSRDSSTTAVSDAVDTAAHVSVLARAAEPSHDTSSRPARSGMLHERLDRDARRTVVVASGVAVDAATAAASAAAREIAGVWQRYKGCADAMLREQLILHYAPLVTSVASRVGMKLPSTVEHADLVSYGMFGLIDAIEKFELDREIKFETSAVRSSTSSVPPTGSHGLSAPRPALSTVPTRSSRGRCTGRRPTPRSPSTCRSRRASSGRSATSSRR